MGILRNTLVTLSLITVLGCTSIESKVNQEIASGKYYRVFDSTGAERNSKAKLGYDSISIYNSESIDNSTGQTNYTLENGKVTRILKSEGQDYPKGIWKEKK